MISDLDIRRAAQSILDRHGDGALIRVAMLCEGMLEEKDLAGAAVWLRVAEVIQDLVRNKLRALSGQIEPV